MKKLLFSLLLLLSISPCSAQNITCATRPPGDSSNACASTAFVQGALIASGFVVGPASSVDGDITIFSGTTGKLVADAGGGIPSIPVIHPSSGNIVGAGCATSHQAWWVDQNLCSTSDSWILNSSDPSALALITVTGTTGTGTLVVTYTFGAGPCVAGCSTTINTTTGQSTSTVATNIVTALKANTNLYNNVAGAQKQLLFLTTGANVVQYDYNVTVSTQVQYTCTACGLTLTFGAGQSTVSTNYTLPTALDNNPVWSVARNPGVAPATGSQLFTINSQSTTSTSPAAIAVSYGAIQNRVVNSTTGSIAGSWLLSLPDVTGSLSRGLTLTSSNLTPTTDNSVALGSGILNYSEVFAYALSIPGAGTGAALIVAQGTAGNPTLTLPNATGTFAISASSPLSLSATTGNLSITSPLPVANGGTGIALGTSGGVPYFSGSTTIASSGVLVTNGIVTGGGSGNAPATTAPCTLDVNAQLTCVGTASQQPFWTFRNSTNDTQATSFFAQKDRAGGAVTSGDSLFSYIAAGFQNSAYRNATQLLFAVDAAPSGNNVPSNVQFLTSNAAGQLNQNLKFNSAGHIKVTPATAPTLTAGCNGAGSAVSGSDAHGTVTGQTSAATTCTLTFATAFAAVPDCVASGLTSPLTGAITPATGTLVVNFASTANFKFTYHCLGN